MSNSQEAKAKLLKWCNYKKILILWLVRHSLVVFLGLGILVTLLVLCTKKDLTALFTGLAFLGTIANLWYQGRQLARQQFENSFFRMLDQLRTMVDNIEFGQNWYRGKSVFKDCYYTLNKLYNLSDSDDSKEELLLKFKDNEDYVL